VLQIIERMFASDLRSAIHERQLAALRSATSRDENGSECGRFLGEQPNNEVLCFQENNVANFLGTRFWEGLSRCRDGLLQSGVCRFCIPVTGRGRRLPKRLRLYSVGCPEISGLCGRVRCAGGGSAEGNWRATQAWGTRVGEQEAFVRKARNQVVEGRVNGITFDAAGAKSRRQKSRDGGQNELRANGPTQATDFPHGASQALLRLVAG
jgi:hypothetical protein